MHDPRVIGRSHGPDEQDAQSGNYDNLLFFLDFNGCLRLARPPYTEEAEMKLFAMSDYT